MILFFTDKMFYKDKMDGPPGNPAHVREWNNLELAEMTSEKGLNPVFSGLMCMLVGQCSTIYDSENSLVSSSLLVTENRVQAKRFKIQQRVAASKINILVLLLIMRKTSPSLITYNCRLLQKITKNVMILEALDTPLPEGCSGFKYFKPELYTHWDKEIMNLVEKHSSIGDWVIIQSANEILSMAHFATKDGPTTLNEFLAKASMEPNSYNAISTSVIFQQDLNGQSFSKIRDGNNMKIPFKIFSPLNWDTWKEGEKSCNNVFPRIDPYNNTVKIWRRTKTPVKLSILKTKLGHHVINSVNFENRQIYPFNLVSLRFHPEFTENPGDAAILKDLVLQLMYNAFMFTGYWESHRDAVREYDILY